MKEQITISTPGNLFLATRHIDRLDKLLISILKAPYRASHKTYTLLKWLPNKKYMTLGEMFRFMDSLDSVLKVPPKTLKIIHDWVSTAH